MAKVVNLGEGQVCAMAGCTELAVSDGLCSTHYFVVEQMVTDDPDRRAPAAAPWYERVRNAVIARLARK
jgi:hypothetical protein